jgi:hypothetical protein
MRRFEATTGIPPDRIKRERIREDTAPLIGYASATGGNMQTAPYQFARNQRDGPQRRMILSALPFADKLIQENTIATLSSQRDYFLFIAAFRGKRNPSALENLHNSPQPTS